MPAKEPIPVPATPTRWMRRIDAGSISERMVPLSSDIVPGARGGVPWCEAPGAACRSGAGPVTPSCRGRAVALGARAIALGAPSEHEAHAAPRRDHDVGAGRRELAADA